MTELSHEWLAVLEAIGTVGNWGVTFIIAWRLLGVLERVLIMVVEKETRD